MKNHIPISEERITDFCRRWKIEELSLFGSILRDDFRPDSDVDVLVAFAPGTRPNLDDWLDMLDELEDIFGREVDLVERRSVTNPFRRYEILTTRQVVYAA